MWIPVQNVRNHSSWPMPRGIHGATRIEGTSFILHKRTCSLRVNDGAVAKGKNAGRNASKGVFIHHLAMIWKRNGSKLCNEFVGNADADLMLTGDRNPPSS